MVLGLEAHVEREHEGETRMRTLAGLRKHLVISHLVRSKDTPKPPMAIRAIFRDHFE